MCVVIVPAPVILAGYFGGFELAITVLAIEIIFLGIFIFFTLSEENPLQSDTVQSLLWLLCVVTIIPIIVVLVIGGISAVKDKNYPLE